MNAGKVRVAVNGYGVIGKRIADAVVLQDDMKLVGLADIVKDWRIKVAVQNKISCLCLHRSKWGRDACRWYPNLRQVG